MAEFNDLTIFSNPLSLQAILPFLLVFFVVFAVLRKSGILGKDKKQIDALVALVVGLITISFKYPVALINQLIPFMAVVLVVLLVFMILFGAVYKEGEFDLHKYVKGGLGIVIGIAVIIAVLFFTGGWDYLLYQLDGRGSETWSTIILLILIVGAVAMAVGSGGGSSGDSK